MSKKIQLSKPENHVAVFQETAIRRTWHNEEWWFVVTDVVAILSSSVNPNDHIKKCVLETKSWRKGGDKLSPPSG